MELFNALNPTLKLRKFSGRSINGPSDEESKSKRVTYIIINLVITFSTLTYTIQCARHFYFYEFNTGQFLVGIAILSAYFGASLLCCINIILQFTSHHNLVKKIQTYQVMSRRDLFVHLEKTNWRLLWVFVILLLVISILLSILFLTTVFTKESVLVRILIVSQEDGLIFSFGVIYFALVTFFISTGGLCDFWTLASFSRILSWEFRSLRDKWLLPGNNDIEGNWHLEIDNFRREYEQVVSLIKTVERTFRFDMLLYFGVIIPVTCIFIYATLQPEDIEEVDLIIIRIVALLVAVQCCSFIYFGAKINSSAHEITEDLYNVDMTNMPSDVISKLSIFLTRLTASPIGISVAGLFTIDNSTILMLAGTLLTYVVVVIQTKPSNTPVRRPELPNCTLT